MYNQALRSGLGELDAVDFGQSVGFEYVDAFEAIRLGRHMLVPVSVIRHVSRAGACRRTFAPPATAGARLVRTMSIRLDWQHHRGLPGVRCDDRRVAGASGQGCLTAHTAGLERRVRPMCLAGCEWFRAWMGSHLPSWGSAVPGSAASCRCRLDSAGRRRPLNVPYSRIDVRKSHFPRRSQMDSRPSALTSSAAPAISR